jgi:hypothetical protein
VLLYVGCDVSDAQRFPRACVSVNRLRRRRSFTANRWILDSGAFTEVTGHGRYRTGPEAYAADIRRWALTGTLEAAVTQDYMCEPFALERTGGTVADHQRWTVERYDALHELVTGVYVMPVVQGYAPGEYVHHLELYAERLEYGSWVGVGSVCKRNRNPAQVLEVLDAIHAARPDLRLHGFGVKSTALTDGRVHARLYSADSWAWSYAARKQGRDGNDWREGERFRQRIDTRPVQLELGAGDA